ncbi:hypothetical protein [Saccharopolyspora sp. 5N708]|uniref:hypothetical protein n=1 Tax=Saccharopolyspora sp. 5N708 TaxID=3457424 RepID=UPI003FD50EA0
MPSPFAPPTNPPEVDLTPLLGSYRRAGVTTTISQEDGSARIRYEFVDGLKDLHPPLETGLVPISPTVFAAPFNLGGEAYSPVVFATLANGTPCVYVFMRAAPKTT